MGIDRKTLDLTQKAKPPSAGSRTPPSTQRSATPPQTAAVRPPPPPLRAKRPEAAVPSVSTAVPARSLSPNPADLAFTRTLPATPANVAPAVPVPAALPALIIQQAQLEEPLEPAMNPRRRAPKLLVGIAAGAVVGIGAAIFFSLGAVRAPNAAKAPATLPAAAHVAAPQPQTASAAVGSPTPAPSPPTDPTSTDTPAVQTAALAPAASGAQSCAELLATAHVEKRDPAASFDQTQLGQRELVKGNVNAAQQAFCKAALWDDTNAERWLNLAQLFLIRRDGAKAAACAQTVLSLQAQNGRALTMLGDASALLGKTAEARQAYLAAENKSEPDAAALRVMIKRELEEAQRMIKLKQFARAERLFRRVLVFDASNAEASASLSVCLTRLQQT